MPRAAKEQEMLFEAIPNESGRFRGVIRFKTVGLRLDKLFACLNLRYRPLRFINFA